MAAAAPAEPCSEGGDPPPDIPRLLTAPELAAAGAWEMLATEARLALAFLLQSEEQQQRPQQPPLPPPALRSPVTLAAALGFGRRLWACEGDPWAGRRMEEETEETFVVPLHAPSAGPGAAASVYEACLQGIHAFLLLLTDRLVPPATATAASNPTDMAAMAGVACGGLLAMDAHVWEDYRRLTGLWKALIHLAVTHKAALVSSSPFDATAALTRLLEYAEQGLGGMERAVESVAEQGQQQGSARSFEQAAKLLTFFLLRIALLAAHLGPATLLHPIPPPQIHQHPQSEPPSPLIRRLAALLIRLRGTLDRNHALWRRAAPSSYPQGMLKTRDTVAAKAESAFHKILIGPTAAASRPTTPEEATAATTATPASPAAVAPAAATVENDGAAQHARVGVALLAAVAVLAAQGARQEGRIGVGARALLIHTLGKACEETAAMAALTRVLYGEHGEAGGLGLAHVMSGLAKATAAATGPDGEGEQLREEEWQDQEAAALMAEAVARAAVCAGSLAAARPHLFHPCLLSAHPRVRRLWAELWRHFLGPRLCHPALQQQLLEALLEVVVAVKGGGQSPLLTRPERVHLAAVAAEGMGAVASWDVKAAFLKRLVELTTAATHALSAAVTARSSTTERQREEQLGVAVALTTALRLAAGSFRHDTDPTKVKALQRTLRPALDLWRQLELHHHHHQQQQQQQPPPPPPPPSAHPQGTQRAPLWGGLGLGWALLTWDAAVPGMALPPDPWAGLLDLAVRVVGEWGQPEGGEEAWACLHAALGTVAIAAVAKREQVQQQQGAAQKARRWGEPLGRAAGAMSGLLQSRQQRSSQDDVAVRLATLPALVALTAACGEAGGGGGLEEGGGTGAMDDARMQDALAQCWVGYRDWQQQQLQLQQRGRKEAEAAASPFVCTAAIAAPAAAAALLLEQGQGVAGTRLGQALQTLAAELQLLLLQHQRGACVRGGGGAAAAASLALLRGHDVLALPRIEVHYQQQQPQQPPMDVDVDLTIDDEQPVQHRASGATMVVALDGRRAVLLPTTNQEGEAAAPPALLLLPVGMGLDRPVHEWVGEVVLEAWQQQGAWRFGAVEGWESQEGQGLLNVRVGGLGGADGGPE